GLPAQLFQTCDAGIDIVDAEVDADCTRVPLKDGPARVLAEPGHVVLHRAFHRLELPAEQFAVELARAARVLCRHLEVNGLSSHGSPFGRRVETYDIRRPGPVGYVVVLARRRGRVARYFVFARVKNSASRPCSPMSQSTNASLYCGEPNFGTCTNSGLVSSLIACTRRTLRTSNALTTAPSRRAFSSRITSFWRYGCERSGSTWP